MGFVVLPHTSLSPSSGPEDVHNSSVCDLQLTLSVRSLIEKMSTKKSAKQAEKLLQEIRKIARLDGNKQCVDCPERV